MFETHLDATYAWFGLALVSVAAVGVVVALPTAPPPDADGVAHTIGSVADGEYVATAEHGLAADRMRLTPRTIELSTAGGSVRSTVRGPPITPVPPAGSGDDPRLRRVLNGVPPRIVFEDPERFADAAARARTADHGWRTAPERLTVRQVRYGGHRVTLAG
ncbi:hypothetical protein SAMN04488066_10759 [Halorubrum aquaticum]|uniref:Uncharacterized protein n=1 Tax=Halorubrum aquaticum TaxID=387340 RepID=A0A1I3AS75_9EURY|nr:hypothetical protein [Halorubrum aquaticum]SFH52874.1 hypothetical protein SAMN04488066_10759 [Halorubrum aquaticum]